MTEPAALSCDALSVDVPGRRLVNRLSAGFHSGEMVCVLGRNGAGKTTTLHTLAGLCPASEGVVRLAGESLARQPRRWIARRLALLMQNQEDPFPVTVLQMVLIGRHPHLDFWQWESTNDKELASDALDEMGIRALADRSIETLSGGERRRLAIAQVLAQDPQVYLLDEPANHLDPQHQIDVLKLLRRRARNGATVIASMHDINLAARFADRALLLFGDGEWLLGDASCVLTAKNLTRLYGTDIRQVPWEEGSLFVAL